VFEPDAFTGLGINLADKRLVVVKSSVHFRAGFEADADHVWSVVTPGALRTDFAAMPYTKRRRDYFPAIEDPWADGGAPVARVFEPVRRRPFSTEP
jgi:microcystin degradation protein MlrC